MKCEVCIVINMKYVMYFRQI